MLNFRWKQQDVALAPGERFSSAVPTSFTDAPAGVLQRLTEEIRTGVPWREVVAREFAARDPWLSRIITSPARDLFFRQFLPLTDQQVLDVGSGWGQQALAFAPRNSVCAVEPNPDKLDFLMAAAGQMKSSRRLYFVQADFLQLEFPPVFDVVTCGGVFEWAGAFTGEPDPQAAQAGFLRRARLALKDGGRCIIGIENRLGLKYLLGVRDDHTGVAGISVLDYPLAKARWQAKNGDDLRAITYTLAEYKTLLRDAGFRQSEFFAAFPDYKLPQQIVPCEPGTAVDDFFLRGGFVPEHDGFDGTLLPPTRQEELQSHYRSLARLVVAARFAPSFFVVSSP